MPESNVQRLQTRRRKPPPMRSHDEIYDLVESSRVFAEGANRKAEDAAHRTDMLTEVAQRVEKKLDDVIRVVGKASEDEKGVPVGTGIVGQVMRLEAKVTSRFTLYDGWLKMVVGFTAGAVPLLAVIWWLVETKVGHILK